MPGQRSKNDTWTEGDLLKAIQGDSSSSKKHRSSREKSSNRERDQSRNRTSKDDKKKEKDRSRSKHRNDESVNEKTKKSEKSERSEKSTSGKTRESREKQHEKSDDHKSSSSKERHKNRSDDKHKIKEKEKVKRDSSKENHRPDKDYSRRNKEEHKNDSKSSEKRSREEKKDKEKRVKSGDKHKSNSEKSSSKHRKEKYEDRSRKEKDSKHSNDDIRESKSKEKKKEVIEREEEKNVDEYNYDDDEFDDYDDDFEDDFEEEGQDDDDNDSSENSEDEAIEEQKNTNHNSENAEHSDENEGIVSQKSMFHLTSAEEQGVDEVLKAITAENDNISSSNLTSKRLFQRKDAIPVKESENQEKQPPPKKTYGKINFMAASQKQINEKVAKRNKLRGEELLKLIQLDVRSIDLFDMPPMTEYELYMKRFGQSNCKQMFTQTNDDDIAQEVQTDEIKMESRWCQHTEDMKIAGVSVDGETDMESIDNTDTSIPLNSRRLNRFLLKASKVCCSLLQELEAGIEQPQKQYTDSRTSFSDGYVTLTASDFVVLGRNFTSMSYSLDETNMLLTAYGSSNVTDVSRKIRNGIICVWNTNEPTKPHTLLVCESTPNSCCFITGTASIVFAGMNDGTIALWDLDEPDAFHEAIKIGRSNHVFHSATFTTAGLRQNNHESPIVSVMPVATFKSNYTQEIRKKDMSFQLASLDQTGFIIIWIIVEVNDLADDFNSLRDDLGLSSRGRIKLVKSGTISLYSGSQPTLDTTFISTSLQIDPLKANHFYIGTQQGMVMHKMRFGKRPSPKKYDHVEECSSMVTSIDISLFELPLLLVSYENGMVSLFHLNKENPVLTWSDFSNNSRIAEVKWSKSLPNVFYAINEQSVFYAWDLLESESGPAFEQKISRKDKRAIGFTLANDYSSLRRGIPSRNAEMAIIYGDGSVEVHRISTRLSVMNGNEISHMLDFVDNVQ